MWKLVKYGTALFIAILVIGATLNIYVYEKGRKYIISSVKNVPQSQVAIILGAAILKDNTLSPVLRDRTDAAIELYKQNKVSKILVSGNNASLSYDEVTPVRRYLEKEGVAPQDIFLDRAGFDTYSSMYRAKNKFQVSSAIIVTQDFHLPRANYIARSLGIEANGFSADDGTYKLKNNFRELVSRPNVFVELILKRKPPYMGEVIPITGDGTLTWE